MLISNLEQYGGSFSPVFYDLLSDERTKRVRIVSGYVSRDIVLRTHEALRGNRSVGFELVVGMALKEGLAQGVYDALVDLHTEISGKRSGYGSRSGVYGFFSGPEGQHDRGMHAKAYLVDHPAKQRLIVGSSNFSFSGFVGNVEMNLTTENPADISDFERFYEDLHSGNQAVALHLIEDFPIRGAASKRRRNEPGAKKVKPPSDFKGFPFVDLDLARNIGKQTKSNLNTFFGKGRLATRTGVIRARDWYEVELIVPKEVTKNPNYPERGAFEVTTSNGWSFEASVQGDYKKNLRSSRDLKILGMWMKGLLEDSGALSQDPYEMVTAETFSAYGNSVMRIYRDGPKSAIFHFPRNPSDL